MEGVVPVNRESILQTIRPLLRWWWLIAAAALVAASTAYLYVRSRPDIYASHSTVMVGSALRSLNPDTAQMQMGAYLASNYAQMAKRSTLQDAAKTALNMQWLPDYEVDVEPDSPMIEVTVYDNEPQRAQAVANELVHQIILLGPGGATAENRNRFAATQLDKMEQDISSTEDEIAKRQDGLAKATSARQIVSLESEISALDNKLTSLRDSYTALLSSTREGAVNAINVVEAASLPSAPESSNRYLLILLAAALGAALAIGGAYLLDFMDDSISGQDEVEEMLHLTPLATIPEIEGSNAEGEEASRLVMYSDPHSAAAEAFRVLRTNVLFAGVDSPIAMLMVTSPAPGEGKSTVTANLAVAMAQAGKRVILVDADMRRPTQHKVFGLRNNSGLSTALLADERAVASAIQKTTIPGLAVLTTGPLPPNPADLVGSSRMGSLLDILKEMSDIVILDTPPTNAVTDAAVLASKADGVLLVLRAGYSGTRQAQLAATGLGHAKTRVLGVVLNGASRTSNAYQYYRGSGSYGAYGTYGMSKQKTPGPQGPPGPQSTTAPNAITRSQMRSPNGSSNGHSNGNGKSGSQGSSSSSATKKKAR